MSVENIIVELTPPTGKQAYTNVALKRQLQITLAAGTVVVDGVTYTRTSPLRTAKADAALGIAVPDVADSQHSQPGVPYSPALLDTPLAIFSASGT